MIVVEVVPKENKNDTSTIQERPEKEKKSGEQQKAGWSELKPPRGVGMCAGGGCERHREMTTNYLTNYDILSTDEKGGQRAEEKTERREARQRSLAQRP